MSRIARSVYRTLLRLVPADLRELHGDQMEELFLEELGAARCHGGMACARAWTGAVIDVLGRAPYEHWTRHRRRRHQPKEQRMHSFLSDLRFAVRSFARQPGATALIVATLALAVAANTAVFSVVDGIFFRPFPFPEPNRLVYLNERAPTWNLEFTGIDYGAFAVWRKTVTAFEAMGLWDELSFNFAGDGAPERVQGARVTYDLPAALRVRPVLGRTFTTEEDKPNGPRVVMISSALWKSRFGGAPNVIGKTLRLNSTPYTIIGVLPPRVEIGSTVQLWVPMAERETPVGQSFSYDGVARLKPGVTLAQAARDLERAHQPVWRSTDSLHVVSPRIMWLRDRFVADYQVVGKALGAGVVLVLLIACANVAGTMLARSIFRRREISIRMALGASSGRVARQLLTESLVVSFVSGIVGIAVGEWGLRLLVASSPGLVPDWVQMSPGPRTVAFSIVIVLATAALFGLVPALQSRRQNVSGALAAGGGRSAGSIPERRVLDSLVVIEIALAAVLLASGGLLLRAYANLRNVDPGFRADGVATFRLSLPIAKYTNGNQSGAFYEALLGRLRALPGVDGAAAITCAPFSCHWGQFFRGEGVPPVGPNASDPVTLMRIASPGYFSTMGIRVVRGRTFAEHEGNPRKGFRPIVVNEEFAQRMWPGVADPTGRRVIGRGDTSQNWLTVTGVVKDVKHYGLAQPMIPGVYLSTTMIDSANNFNSLAFMVHTSGNPAALFAAIRAAVRSLDPELPLFQEKTMRAALDQSFAQRRTIAMSLAIFAAIALTLAVGGIYAVLSYVVGRRRQEIGIRMALGAQRAQVLELVVRQGLTLVAAGLVIGLPAAFFASRFVASLLVGVKPGDPATYAVVVALLVATGFVAALVPAKRAAAVEPQTALREG